MTATNFRLGLDTESFNQVTQMLAELGPRARLGASVGMNRTANEMQDAIRANVDKSFTLRRAAFIRNTIYRKPGEDFATKERLVAGLRVHEERNFLAKHEVAHSKRATKASGSHDKGRAIAIPVGARPNPQNVVPQRLTLRALLANTRSLGSQALAIARTKGKGTRKMLKRRSVVNDIFIKDGKVWQRQGKTRMNLLWVFKDAVWIKPRLSFVETALRVHRERFAPNVIGAIQIEIDRGLNLRSKPKGAK